MKLKLTHFCSLALFITSTAFAQYTEVINSNRPGASKGAFSVGTNVIQLEAGPYMVKEKHALTNYEVSGYAVDFAARYGLLLDELELSLDGIYQNDTYTAYSSDITAESSRSNFRNLSLGAKYLFFDPFKNSEEEKPNLYSYHANRKFKWHYLIPAISAYVGVNYDSKNNPYTAPTVEGMSFKALIATQHNFNGGWVFVTNLMMDRIGSDDSSFQYIITLTKSIGQRFAVFGEAHGFSGNFYADNLFRVGGGYLFSKDFQIDTSVTFNTKDTPSVFHAGVGASYRFDFHKDKNVNDGTSVEEEAKRKDRKVGKKRKKQKQEEEFNDDSGLD
ncbi:MAG: transporter [Flavobacteriaceae bacterium]|nr:transporter [Flavobacteriaceae bacterium]